MDGVLLFLTVILMKKKVVWRRIIIAAGCGAIFATALMMIDNRYGLLYMIIVFLMVKIALRININWKKINIKNMTDLMTGTVYFYAMSFVFTKLFEYGCRYWITDIYKGVLIIVVSVMMIAGTGLIAYYNNRKKHSLYKVDIVNDGKKLEVKALFDTGNSLKEPFSGKPVSVIEKEKVKEVLTKERPEKCKIIPFHSIGREHGMLTGMEVDEMIIWCGDDKKIYSNAIIALYEGKLSNDDSYQMILNRVLL